MKRLISVFISLILLINIALFQSTAIATDTNLPTHDCELGFIFSTNGEQFNKSFPNDYDGISEIWDDLNMYYAVSLDSMKNIEDKFIITNWKENTSIKEPIIESVENIGEDSDESPVISLFSEENGVDDMGNLYLNDPLFIRQWYYEAVHAQAYRDNGITGIGVKVGVIDSGFDENLLDFDYEKIEKINVPALIDENKDRLYAAPDSSNHGVPVTSVIAAQTDNSIGIGGLTDKVNVKVYKIRDHESSVSANSASFYKAIRMAYEDGCDVVNISQGATYFGDDLERELIDYATQNGMIIVAGVGNDGNKEETLNRLSFPAAMNKVIAVGAVEPTCEQVEIWYDEDTGFLTSNGRRGASTWLITTIQDNPDTSYVKCDFSTANESIFVAAPGRSIIMDNANNDWYSGNWYIASGTSFSSPIVSAAAIGVKQMRPYVDTDMFKEILKATSVDLDEEGYDINTGWGMVDFQAIYNYVSQMPDAIPEVTPNVYIDFLNGNFIGFSDGDYIINDEEFAIKDGKLSIKDEWYDTDLSIIKKASETYYINSEPQALAIPDTPTAPEGVISGYNEISSLNDTMEYKASDSDMWLSCSSEAITDLPAGIYEVRYKASETTFASKIAQVEVLDKPKEDTPNIEIDFENSVLTGFNDEKTYTIDGEEIRSINGQIALIDKWYDTTLNIVTKSSDENHTNSEAQELDIPAIPIAPTGITTEVGTGVYTGEVIKISGITDDMEYKISTSDAWLTAPEGGIIYNPADGTYEFRYKATNTSFASKATTIKVKNQKAEPFTDEEYVIKTQVSYNSEAHKVEYAIRNMTIKDISATAFIAIYKKDGSLGTLKTVNSISSGTLNDSFEYTGDIGSVKLFIWKDLQSMQPYPNALSSIIDID